MILKKNLIALKRLKVVIFSMKMVIYKLYIVHTKKNKKNIPIPSYDYVIKFSKRLIHIRQVKTYYHMFDCPHCLLLHTKELKLLKMKKVDKIKKKKKRMKTLKKKIVKLEKDVNLIKNHKDLAHLQRTLYKTLKDHMLKHKVIICMDFTKTNTMPHIIGTNVFHQCICQYRF